MSLDSISAHQSVFARPRNAGQWRQLLQTVLEWRRRAVSRRELALLSPFDLKDIGYPENAEAERSKPFWQP